MVEWKTFNRFSDYEHSINLMENAVKSIISGNVQEQIWLLEYEPLYTKGTSGRDSDILDKMNIPVLKTKRGGQITYHGPGQRIIYPLLNLRNYQKDVRCYIWMLEEWLIKTLDSFNIKSHRQIGDVGVWVSGQYGEEKIAAIGVRISKWISSHGLSVNVKPDLSKYQGIVPCGIKDRGVTSLFQLGVNISYEDFDEELKKAFLKVFKKI